MTHSKLFLHFLVHLKTRWPKLHKLLRWAPNVAFNFFHRREEIFHLSFRDRRKLKDHTTPSPSHGQVHLSLDWVAPSPAQPDLEHIHRCGMHSIVQFFVQQVSVLAPYKTSEAPKEQHLTLKQAFADLPQWLTVCTPVRAHKPVRFCRCSLDSCKHHSALLLWHSRVSCSKPQCPVLRRDQLNPSVVTDLW